MCVYKIEIYNCHTSSVIFMILFITFSNRYYSIHPGKKELVLLVELYGSYEKLKTHYTLTHMTTMYGIRYTGSFFYNHHFGWAVVRTFVAMGCTKSILLGGMTLTEI